MKINITAKSEALKRLEELIFQSYGAKGRRGLKERDIQLRRVALVTQVLSGGVGTVTDFLYRVLSESGRYQPEIILVANSAFDKASVRLLSPKSWVSGIQVFAGQWKDISYRHVGGWFTEFEFQRYRSRSHLTNILNTYDLVQVIAGSPAWGNLAGSISKPTALQVATLAKVEARAGRLSARSGPLRVWIRLMVRIGSWSDDRALRRMNCVFVENDLMLNYVKSVIGTERTVMALPGVDTKLFHPDFYQPNGYILSVGRFDDPRKNIRLLMSAYARLCQSLAPAPDLTLVGSAPPSLEDMEYARNLGIDKKLSIRVNVSLPELTELYRGASIFALSSNEEGLGLVILEAMASGLPVISTRCGGPEMVVIDGETGLLTPTRDVEAFAEALKRLVVDPDLRQRMGTASRRIAEERLDLKVTGDVFLRKYDELLSLKAEKSAPVMA